MKQKQTKKKKNKVIADRVAKLRLKVHFIKANR